MARQIDIVSTSRGEHYLLFGFNAGEMAKFSIQLWITHYGLRAVDWLQSLSLGYCSFMSGDVYLHNSDEVDRCNLFGEQKDFKVGIVMNEDPPHTKILDSLGIYTNGEWEVESVTIQPDQNYPDGMSSFIPKSFFKKREGVLYSEFLRNMKTSSSTPKAIEALTGEALRGNCAYLVLKNTSADKVEIWMVNLQLTKSR